MERTAAWVGHGIEYKTKSLEEAFKAYDLDYVTKAMPVYGRDEESGLMVPVKGCKVTYREDTNEAFGIVSNKYPIIQNREALGFIESVIGDSDMELIRGGHFSWGSYYMIGQLPPMKILGDEIRPHLIFQSSHDGSVPLKSTICMLRMVCQNQFAYSFKESPATIKIIHRGDTEEKIRIAAQTLSSVREYLKVYEEKILGFSKEKITPKKFNEIVEGFFKMPEYAGPRTENRILQMRDEFQAAYEVSDNGNFKGTKLGLINAFTDYNTHREVRNPENRFWDSVNPDGEVSRFVNFLEEVA